MNVTAPQTQVFPGLPDELVASPTFLLKRLGYAAKERSHEGFESMGLSPYHYAVLLVLEEGSRETQGAIAHSLGYDPGQLVGLLDQLEERGLVERRRDPRDRRRHLVTMTAEGKHSLARMRAMMKKIEDEFLGPLDDGERETLYELLHKLALVHEPRCAMGVPPQPS
jgi:DNA-binding MarR family transcriptional regulator